MSKAAARRVIKKVTEKIQHGPMKTNIPAGMAAAGPPLGPMLGQVFLIQSHCLNYQNLDTE